MIGMFSLLPSGEKVGAEGARMRGPVPFARSMTMNWGPAAPSSVSLREPPSPLEGEGS